MQYTDHYNLNLPEGTDIVNPLVQDNPNYTAIDGALYANKLRTVGNATEVKSGTVHAITRSDSDIDVIRFTATGDWITGDTMTVDGTPVSVYLPDGSAPLTGAYVINSEVLMIINGSRVTLYGIKVTPTPNAAAISYDGTSSGLSANDVQGAIDENNSMIDAINGELAGMFKTVSFSGTTSTIGGVVLVDENNSQINVAIYDLVSAWSYAPDQIVLPYIYSGVWCAIIYSTTLNAIVNTNVTLRVVLRHR